MASLSVPLPSSARVAAEPTVGTSGEIVVVPPTTMFPLDLLSVFAATSAAGNPSNSNNGADGSDLEFPGEQPTDKQLSDWLDAIGPGIRRIYGAALSGDTPSHLIKLQHGADDLTGFTRFTAGTPAAAGMSVSQLARHNREVVKAEAEKVARAAELLQGLREHKDALAQYLETKLRKRAGLRWKRRLKAAHTDGD